jgi:HAD superfamily hydrolase (TIGR01484 family)
MLKLIFCDIDGTLTGLASELVDSGIQECVKALQECGVKFGIATSHWVNGPWTDQFCEYYNLDFMVLENGSVIYLRNDDSSYQQLIAYDNANQQKLADFEAFKNYVMAEALPAQNDNVFIDGIEVRIDWRCASLFTHTVNDNDDLLPVMARLEQVSQGNGWQLKFIEPRTFAMEIGIANKADGVQFLAAHLGIPLQQTCAIGDGDNDIEMLGCVGLPGCPADVGLHVQDVVRSGGGIIASEQEAAGTRQILKQLVRDQTG